MPKKIVGVMGPGTDPTDQDLAAAFELGKLIAKQDWILLTGGRDAGVMHAASKGAKEAGGLTIGVLPGKSRAGSSPCVDIPVITDTGSGRNNINILTSDVIVACGSGLGTTSEIVLALKAGKPVVLLHQHPDLISFLRDIAKNRFTVASSPDEAISRILDLI